MKTPILKYKCIEDFIGNEDELFFKKDNFYNFQELQNDWMITNKNNLGFSHELKKEEINEYFELVDKNKPATQISDSNEDRLKYIDVTLRLANIQLNQELLVKIVKVVDLVNEKGGKVSVEDIVKL
jgi:hypothetical protein